MRTRLALFTYLMGSLLPMIMLSGQPVSASHREVNGCGDDSGLGRAVPNQPSGVDFRPVCDDHDRCYGTLGQSRRECDDKFERALRARCERDLLRSTAGIFGTVFTGGQALTACYSIAQIYYQAVRERGGSAYAAAQRHALEERDSSQATRRSQFRYSTGSFIDRGNSNWIEIRDNGPSSMFIETNRNPSFIELYDRSRNFSVRLFSDRALGNHGANGSWVPWPGSNGRWSN